MNHCLGWNVNQYIRKKKRLFHSIRSSQIDRDTIVETRGEIMPGWILKFGACTQISLASPTWDTHGSE